MPYSFTQIEKDKSHTIAIVFTGLIGFYSFTFWLIYTVIKVYIASNTSSGAGQGDELIWSWPTLFESFNIVLLSAVVGFGHWLFSISGMIDKILRVLHAEQLNPQDSYHKVFQNILDEVTVATGGKHKMEGVVIPTSALNAFALSDFDGRNVIGVTEGLLGRLNRSQLEAVVGHEAAHIVSGDCKAVTITSSLFELFNGLLRVIEEGFFYGRRGYRRSRSSRDEGGIHALILVIYLILLVSRFVSMLFRMFISRQREYRADAVAVRLTRNPLALAEALYAIGYFWKGEGLSAEELESVFIISPKFNAMDEGFGPFAQMFSTHPPLGSRLDVLINMAHTDIETLAKEMEASAARPRVAAPAANAPDHRWMLHKDGEWQGPFDMTQMMTLGWIRPDMWVSRMDNREVKMLRDDPDLIGISQDYGSRKSGYACPKCRIPLSIVVYEGIDVHTCSSCHGILMPEGDVKRVIIRLDIGFNDRVKKIGDTLIKENDIFTPKRKELNRDPESLLTCPKCQPKLGKMNRMFYTESCRVEVDKCLYCGLIWFDQDELEILQYIIEQNTLPDSVKN